MSTLLWASDLHLDHADGTARERFSAALAAQSGAVVVLSGDLSVASRLVSDLEFVARVAQRPVYFVLGNHDHYGGRIGQVRDDVIALAERNALIRWLPPAGVIPLDPDTALVGVDGWAEGRVGDPLTTPLRLNDDRLIGELAAQPSRAARLAVKRSLADADASRLATLLDRAAALARRIVVVTHVPPFEAALPSTGRLAAPEWLPLLVCHATGNALRAAAAAHPGLELLVLCGHTHVATDVMVLPNLRCRVAGARYGEPMVTALEL